MNDAITARALGPTASSLKNAVLGKTWAGASLEAQAALLDGTCAMNTTSTQVTQRLRTGIPVICGTKVILVMQSLTLAHKFLDGPNRGGHSRWPLLILATVMVMTINKARL
jgi:hypothetical protein